MSTSNSNQTSSPSSSVSSPPPASGASPQASAAVNSGPRSPQEAINSFPGTPQAAVNPVPGPPQAEINPVPGPPQAAVNPVPGPPQAEINAVPGPPQAAVNSVPGPPQAAINPVPGPSLAAVNPVPGPPQAAVNPVPGPSQPPEDVWLPFIQQNYPNRLQKTYFLPPIHFRRKFYTVKHFEAEDIAVMQPQQPERPQKQQPQRRCQHRRPQPQPQPQGYGHSRLFTPNPPGLQPSRHQESDIRDDQAQYHTLQCLKVLSDNQKEAMVVISQLKFRKYLDDRTNPVHAAAINRLPSKHSLPAQLVDGECDVLMINRQQGIIVGEIKSMGEDSTSSSQPSDSQNSTSNSQPSDPQNSTSSSQPSDPQNSMIVKRMERAVKQVNNQEMALRHLVSDLNIKVTRTLMFPNLDSAQLLQALSNTGVEQDLCQCVGAVNLQEAVDRCLCRDRMPSTADLQTLHSPAHQPQQAPVAAMSQLTAWWQRIIDGGPDPNMTDEVYDRLLARFCGPATTVEVYTPTNPPLVIRTDGEAVAESGLRLSRLALTQEQLDRLNQPDYDQKGSGFVYLLAPPGCGKTIMLYLKAKQWLRHGRHVHVLCMSWPALAVSFLLAAQLRKDQGTAAAVTTHMFDFVTNPGDVKTALQTLVGLAVSGYIHVIADEANSDSFSGSFRQFCRDLQTAVPKACLWAGGVTSFDPPLLGFQETGAPLTICLRCPPSVQRQVQASQLMNGSYVLNYSNVNWPIPTEGLEIVWLRHQDEAGHAGGQPRDCQKCGEDVGRRLHDLQMGKCGLLWKDVFVVCEDPSAIAPITVGLQAAGVPLDVINSSTAAASNIEQMAMAQTDRVIVTDIRCIRGLERRVIVGMEGGIGDRLDIMSRCTSLLIFIGTPDDD